MLSHLPLHKAPFQQQSSQDRQRLTRDASYRASSSAPQARHMQAVLLSVLRQKVSLAFTAPTHQSCASEAVVSD